MKALCPECAQGKSVNCTGEAMVADVMVACGTESGPAPVQSPESILFAFVEGSAATGATLPEMRDCGAIGDGPPYALGKLSAEQRLVMLRETRSGWNVWVTAADAEGREIAFSGFGNKTGETDKP